MDSGINNINCYWLDECLNCRFEGKVDRPPCALDKICCRYVSADKVDDYIRMLLESLVEL